MVLARPDVCAMHVPPPPRPKKKVCRQLELEEEWGKFLRLARQNVDIPHCTTTLKHHMLRHAGDNPLYAEERRDTPSTGGLALVSRYICTEIITF